ncbi:acyltransferase, partial [Escherichia coli]|nr:acyltransferase [Escherichia coli]
SGGVLTIGNGVFFNENNHLVCHSRFEIGDDCLFGQNVCFYDSDHEFNDVSKKIREQGYIKGNIIISDDVWIGAGSVITKNTYIGKHSVIGANSVVRGELQSNSIYAGNPTKLIRKINA